MGSASIRGEAHIRVGGYVMDADKGHSLSTVGSRCCTSLLGPNEPRAPIVNLSPAKREALVALKVALFIDIAGHGFQQQVITGEGASLA
jgi:hypothetical protein